MDKCFQSLMTIAILASWLSSGLAQDELQLTPGTSLPRSRGMIVEGRLQNDQSTFRVRVMVDKPNRTYLAGEEMRVSVISEESGYLYLLYQQADGSTKCLFPNLYESDNYIQGGTPITIPTEKQQFRLRASEPYGEEVLMALVTKEKIAVESVLGASSLVEQQATDVELGVLARSIDDQRGIKVEGGMASMAADQWTEHHVAVKTLDRDQPSPPTEPRRFVLAIGISDYLDRRILDLNICHKDAMDIVKTLREYGRLDGQILLTNSKATRDRIERAFGELATTSQPGDEIIIYWSGHGETAADTDGDEKDGLEEYLTAYDTKYGDAYNTAISDDMIGRWVQNFDGRKVLMILDACHSGGNAEGKSLSNVAKGSATPVLMKSVFQRLNRLNTKDVRAQDAWLLMSSRSDELSAERRDGKGSVMTYALLEKIASSSTLNLQQAFDYVSTEVPKYTASHFPGFTQTPQLVPLQGAADLWLR